MPLNLQKNLPAIELFAGYPSVACSGFEFDAAQGDDRDRPCAFAE